MRESFTKAEIVAILDAAYDEGVKRREAKVLTPEEERGWAVAIAHVAGKFGVFKEWHDYTPPARAEKIQ